jgi:hypothetical protein
MELASSALFDTFFITGFGNLDGTLALSCFAGCSLNFGDIFLILDTVGDLTGTFAKVTTSGFDAAFQYSLIYDYTADEVRLQVIEPGATVPETGTWVLLCAGLCALAAVARRRHTKRAVGGSRFARSY